MKEEKITFPENYVRSCRENFGKIIRSRREEKGYSQDELAGIMDVQRSTISKIENGKFGISIDYIVKFAWYLDFDIELLPKEKLSEK
jgi:transcriptional regulator with XRE-family HTH domain